MYFQSRVVSSSIIAFSLSSNMNYDDEQAKKKSKKKSVHTASARLQIWLGKWSTQSQDSNLSKDTRTGWFVTRRLHCLLAVDVRQFCCSEHAVSLLRLWGSRELLLWGSRELRSVLHARAVVAPHAQRWQQRLNYVSMQARLVQLLPSLPLSTTTRIRTTAVHMHARNQHVVGLAHAGVAHDTHHSPSATL